MGLKEEPPPPATPRPRLSQRTGYKDTQLMHNHLHFVPLSYWTTL